MNKRKLAGAQDDTETQLPTWLARPAHWPAAEPNARIPPGGTA
jgi:hypothetical protein